MTPIRGGCLCGAVRFEITATPRHITYCHCSRCRKAGGVFAAIVMVKAEDFRMVSGEEHIAAYRPPPPWTHVRCFCELCGSPLGEPLTHAEAFPIAVSALDDDPVARPVLHLNTAAKPAWYEITDGVKQVSGNYGE